MKKIIALALVLVMIFALSACGKEEAPVVTEAPQQAEPVQPEAAEPEAVVEATEPPVETPVVTEPVGIESDSGIYTFTSDVNGFSFDCDSKYVATQNPLGNATVFAGTDTGIPYCSVALFSETDAESYLNDINAAAEIELDSDLISAGSTVAAEDYADRNVFYTSYSYADEEAGSNVVCVYYAENLEDGTVAVFGYTAFEGQTEDVDSIISLAIDTFSLTK